MKNRIAVTGIGVMSSIGIAKEEFWRNLISGKSGISEVSQFSTKNFKRHYAGEIKNFAPEEYMPRKAVKYIGRSAQLAIAASKNALIDAGLSLKDFNDSRRIFLALGTTMPEDHLIDYCAEHINSGTKNKISKVDIQNLFPHSIAHNVSYYLGMNGNGLLIPNACGAGNFSIAYCCEMIINGQIDAAIAGGTESMSRVAFEGFQTLRAMAEDKCAPFDKNRHGMLLGEGSGILILENYEKALRRKAHIYAEVLGYGYSCDAHNMTIPKKEGVYKAMKKALVNSDIKPSAIDYISAHGTGTIANDKNETAAIKDLFGARYNKIPISSIKSMLGHTMGAASAIEAISCCMAIERGIIPPTINYTTPDPDCNIDCVPNVARTAHVKMALNNGFAFGGNNCCVVFSNAS